LPLEAQPLGNIPRRNGCRGGYNWYRILHCPRKSGRRTLHAVCDRLRIRLDQIYVYRRRDCPYLLYCPGVHDGVCRRQGSYHRRPCIREADGEPVMGWRPRSSGSRARLAAQRQPLNIVQLQPECKPSKRCGTCWYRVSVESKRVGN